MNKDNFLDPTETPKDPQDIKMDKIINAHLSEDEHALTINIYDYIALLTVARENEDGQEKIDTENLINILAFLGEKYKAKTVYEASKTISERKVPENIIELWIEKDMVNSLDLNDAIREGYLDLAVKINKK